MPFLKAHAVFGIARMMASGCEYFFILILATTVSIVALGANLKIFFSALRASFGFTARIIKLKSIKDIFSNSIICKFCALSNSALFSFLSTQAILDVAMPLFKSPSIIAWAILPQPTKQIFTIFCLIGSHQF